MLQAGKICLESTLVQLEIRGSDLESKLTLARNDLEIFRSMTSTQSDSLCFLEAAVKQGAFDLEKAQLELDRQRHLNTLSVAEVLESRNETKGAISEVFNASAKVTLIQKELIAASAEVERLCKDVIHHIEHEQKLELELSHARERCAGVMLVAEADNLSRHQELGAATAEAQCLKVQVSNVSQTNSALLAEVEATTREMLRWKESATSLESELAGVHDVLSTQGSKLSNTVDVYRARAMSATLELDSLNKMNSSEGRVTSSEKPALLTASDKSVAFGCAEELRLLCMKTDENFTNCQNELETVLASMNSEIAQLESRLTEVSCLLQVNKSKVESLEEAAEVSASEISAVLDRAEAAESFVKITRASHDEAVRKLCEELRLANEAVEHEARAAETVALEAERAVAESEQKVKHKMAQVF
jgi:TolA-binding protein